MRDLMLRFADQAEWDATGVRRDPGLFEVDLIGAIEATPGWHVNIRCRDARPLDALEPFTVTPEMPVRCWA